MMRVLPAEQSRAMRVSPNSGRPDWWDVERGVREEGEDGRGEEGVQGRMDMCIGERTWAGGGDVGEKQVIL